MCPGPRLSLLPEPWRLSVYAGAYYTTMVTSAEGVGYHNVTGPQLYPVISRALAGGRSSLSAYFKYSPVFSGFSVLDLSASRELATGLGFTHPLGLVMRDSGLSWNFDYSDLALKTSTGMAHTRTIGLGVALVFRI